MRRGFSPLSPLRKLSSTVSLRGLRPILRTFFQAGLRPRLWRRLKQAPKLYLRNTELYYDLSDAIRDSILIYLIQSVEESLDEKQLSDLLGVLI